jgi:hypothetical protein
MSTLSSLDASALDEFVRAKCDVEKEFQLKFLLGQMFILCVIQVEVPCAFILDKYHFHRLKDAPCSCRLHCKMEQFFLVLIPQASVMTPAEHSKMKW